MKKTVGITLFLTSLITLGLVSIQPTEAQYQGNVTINADGSINPSAAPIKQEGDTYILTDDLIGSRITVLRSNMTLDGSGHAIQGGNTTALIQFPSGSTVQFPSSFGGIYLERVHNVSVKGFSIRSCFVGVSLNQSSYVALSGNNITGTWGAYAFSPQLPAGIFLWESSNNTINGNRLEGNEFGLSLRERSGYNIIVGNTISGSANKGVLWSLSSNNIFYHNNFDNELNVYDSDRVSSSNVWDNGEEGNFWRGYSGPDANGDGIGGSAYIINSNNRDRHPLMKPWEPDVAPPNISVYSPENKTYTDSNVMLTFLTSEPASKISYNLDENEGLTTNGNVTLSGLTNGEHKVTIYALDNAGNFRKSETVSFTVAEPESFPTVPVAAVSAASIIAVCLGLMVYLKNRQRDKNP